MSHYFRHTATRRQFLGAVIGASFALPAWSRNNANASPLRLGLIADVHKDIMHDADSRLGAFIDAMKEANVDSVLQLGDFCTPKEENKGFRNIFDRFDGPRYHVLGNHETDGGFEREDAVKFLGMPARYYSFDMHGYHFAVLDANDVPDGHTSGYPSHIAADQIEWLKDDLASTDSTVFVFVHQSLERESSVVGDVNVRGVLEEARTPDGIRKVAAVFNGHHHIDHARVINGIPYIHVNSASYFWLGGEQFQHQSYSEEIHSQYRNIRNTSPYKEPLYTILTIDPERGSFSMSAAETDWQGPSPKELGFDRGDMVSKGWVAPKISGRSIAF